MALQLQTRLDELPAMRTEWPGGMAEESLVRAALRQCTRRAADASILCGQDADCAAAMACTAGW